MKAHAHTTAARNAVGKAIEALHEAIRLVERDCWERRRLQNAVDLVETLYPRDDADTTAVPR